MPGSDKKTKIDAKGDPEETPKDELALQSDNETQPVAAAPVKSKQPLVSVELDQTKVVVGQDDDGPALTPWVPQDEPQVGETFCQKFEIEMLLGKGGMSKVYKAEDKELRRVVAIKTLHPHLLEREDSVLRFKREARSMSELEHAGIVRVHEFDISEKNIPFIVMEYLEGTPLDIVLIQEGKLTYARAVPIFMQMAEAFAHAHAKGVIHRDLKPSNVILRERDGNPDSVCIIDFGLAKFVQHTSKESASLTTTGHIFGSPPYMSPEQCHGEKLDQRTDIYSLGCLMYECLTGRPPLEGETSVATVVKQLTDIPAPLNKYANVPPTLEAMVLKSLQKDPAKRQQSMAEILDELRNFERLQDAGQEYKPVELNLQLQNQWQRHTKVWAAALGAVVLFVTFIVASWYHWLTQWSGYEFMPRMLASLFVIALICFGSYKAWHLDRRMRAREVDALIPKIAWREDASPLPPAEAESKPAEAMTACIEDSTGNSAEHVPQIRELAQALISTKRLDDLTYRANYGIEQLKKRGEEISPVGYLLKELLADVMTVKGEHARAEAIYREMAYPADQIKRKEVDTRTAELKLADSLYLQSRFADAQTLYSACLFAIHRLGVERDIAYALRLSRLGDCYLQIESFKLAEEHYVSAMALWKELGSPINRSIAFIKYAYVSDKRFRPIKADTAFASAVDEIKRVFGQGSPEYSAAVKLYARLLWREGDLLSAYMKRNEIQEKPTA